MIFYIFKTKTQLPIHLCTIKYHQMHEHLKVLDINIDKISSVLTYVKVLLSNISVHLYFRTQEFECKSKKRGINGFKIHQ